LLNLLRRPDASRQLPLRRYLLRNQQRTWRRLFLQLPALPKSQRFRLCIQCADPARINSKLHITRTFLNKMNTQPFISIAIPTYNRAMNLMHTLGSVFKELSEIEGSENIVEVVVCDNASTDETKDLMSDLISKHRNLNYYRNDKNYGIDENIRQSVLRSRGKFVRLLSDDDEVIQGSIRRLITFLNERSEVGFLFLNAATLVQKNGILGIGAGVVDGGEKAYPICMQPTEFIEKVGVWITFISSFVVRRDLWISDIDDSQYVGTDVFLSYKAIDVVTTAGEGYFDPFISIGVRPHFSGSYRIFKAFGQSLRHLLLQHAVNRGLDPKKMKNLLKRCFAHDLIPRISRARRSNSFSSADRVLVIGSAQGMGFIKLRIIAASSFPMWLLKLGKFFKKIFVKRKAGRKVFSPLRSVA
jgi:glycosyltransferase involved in cell wall biosynthesis